MNNIKTFEEIVPLWSKKIKERGLAGAEKICKIDDKILDIGNFERCIVGEAYHFNFQDRYCHCPTCYNFAYKFHDAIKDQYTRDLLFEDVKQSFVNHWNLEHNNNNNDNEG